MEKLIKKIVIGLKILQEEDNSQRSKKGLKKLGKGYNKAYRLNPYNPLSYLVVLFVFPVLAFVSTIETLIKLGNPFVWD